MDATQNIEITEEMIEAGVDELGAFWLGLVENPSATQRQAVMRIFQRMVAAQQIGPHENSQSHCKTLAI